MSESPRNKPTGLAALGAASIEKSFEDRKSDRLKLENDKPNQRRLRSLAERLKVDWSGSGLEIWAHIGFLLALEQPEFAPPKRKRGRPKGSKKTTFHEAEVKAIDEILSFAEENGCEPYDLLTPMAHSLVNRKEVEGDVKSARRRLKTQLDYRAHLARERLRALAEVLLGQTDPK